MTLSIRAYFAAKAISAVDPLRVFNDDEMESQATNAFRFADAMCKAGGLDPSEPAFPSPGGLTIVTDGLGGSPGGSVPLTRPQAPPPPTLTKVTVTLNGQPYSFVEVPAGATRKEVEAAICKKHTVFAEENRAVFVQFTWDPEASIMDLSWSQG